MEITSIFLTNPSQRIICLLFLKQLKNNNFSNLYFVLFFFLSNKMFNKFLKSMDYVLIYAHSMFHQDTVLYPDFTDTGQLMYSTSCRMLLLTHLEETVACGLWFAIPISILTKFSLQSNSAHFSDLERCFQRQVTVFMSPLCKLKYSAGTQILKVAKHLKQDVENS